MDSLWTTGRVAPAPLLKGQVDGQELEELRIVAIGQSCGCWTGELAETS